MASAVYPTPPIVRSLDEHAATGASRHLTSGEVAAVAGYIGRLRDVIELLASAQARPVGGDVRARSMDDVQWCSDRYVVIDDTSDISLGEIYEAVEFRRSDRQARIDRGECIP